MTTLTLQVTLNDDEMLDESDLGMTYQDVYDRLERTMCSFRDDCGEDGDRVVQWQVCDTRHHAFRVNAASLFPGVEARMRGFSKSTIIDVHAVTSTEPNSSLQYAVRFEGSATYWLVDADAALF